MSEEDALVLAVMVRVVEPCLVRRGMVDITTVALVARLFLQEKIGNITGGLAEIEVLIVGFVAPEDRGE